ncbi:glutaminyl-peptide cyclotransferase [Urechidicola croceus]|uniref:Glutamine cyclotransferase n=1 Tax=Urechidicola croceus TaxID=1850246 RepID=A0A1D8P6U7_9FLAO|nr:glutaminyl-peptide cyclotransferase [Urechidicola croceus]AOW20295.1 glutamine cyclotransferase [Urechidicola croceus]
MSFKQILPFLLIVTIITSCKTEYNFSLKTPKKLNINNKLNITFNDKNKNSIDSVQFSIDNNIIKTGTNLTTKIDISDYKLGRHTVNAVVFYEGKTKKVTNTIYFLADEEPVVYDYKVINTFPHDKNAYTQGLEIHNGFLYESTGHRGKSTLRKVELTTGKVLKQINLDNQYFGEGITKFGDEIFMLTWQKGVGFIYDFNSFEQKNTFKYKNSIEGWGLTNNGEKLIKTDGTERIWFLNPSNQAEESYIEAYTNKRKVEKLNELEYIDGKIYANIYQQNSILIVDSNSGKIEGVANLNGLRDMVEQHPQLDVLNGIAYDKETKKLYVTGKNWSKLFEIELIKRN